MSVKLIQEWNEYVESMGSDMGEAEHIAQRMCEHIQKLTTAIESAIIEADRPHYGYDEVRMDNYFDAIEILRKVMVD